MALYIVYRNDNLRIVGTYRTDKEPPNPDNKTVEQVTKADMLDTIEKMQAAAELGTYVTRENGISILQSFAPVVMLDCDNTKIRAGESTTITFKAKGAGTTLTINNKSIVIADGDTFNLTVTNNG